MWMRYLKCVCILCSLKLHVIIWGNSNDAHIYSESFRGIMILFNKIHAMALTMLVFVHAGCIHGVVNEDEEMDSVTIAPDMREAQPLDASLDMKGPRVDPGDAGSDASIDMPLDMRSDMPLDMPLDMFRDEGSPRCSLLCPCGGICKNGVVTIEGAGSGWDGICGQEPSCGPTLYQCPNGCADNAPQSSDPQESCQAAQRTSLGDWSDFCAPE